MGHNHKIIFRGSPIGSLKTLSKVLDTTEVRLINISNNIENYYIEFEKTVKNKTRTLAEPTFALKTIQKKINCRIFSNIEFPHYLHGGIKSDLPKDFFSNAKSHQNAETIITLDIKNFFPSVNNAHVQNIFTYCFKFPKDVSEVLTRLTTLHDSLPQGAPTSSYIANLVLFEKEYRLAARLESQGLTYTRLIDDITVSSSVALTNVSQTKIANSIISMLRSYDFVIHPDKKQFLSRRNPENLMTVTGLWVNRGEPKVARAQRKKIGYEVISLLKNVSCDDDRCSRLFHESYNSISGKVALLQRANHKESKKLRDKLASIKPIYDDANVAKLSKIVRQFCNKEQDRTKFGYIKKFYRLQNSIAIIKRTKPGLAKSLQRILTKKRPEKTIGGIYE